METTLITANLARELVNESNVNIDKTLNYLCKEIRKAATDGKREFCPPDINFKPINPYSSSFSVFQSKIKCELEKLGFTFEIVVINHPSAPPGLGSNDDEWSKPWSERKIKIGW